MKIFNKLFLFLKNVPDAFQEINSEKGILSAFLISTSATITGCALNLLLAMILNRKMFSLFIKTLNLTTVFEPAAIAVILLFILTLIIHPILKLFKAKSGLATTYKIIAYSSIPHLLLMGLPFFSKWVFFLTAFLTIYGIKTLHKLTALKSFLVVLLLYFIYWIASLFVGKWLLLLFQGVTL
ncbi:hypothetical protein DRJ22_04975 [Candidatus Woesearchaeota archaeon]|nr:MAG: hypothetical protein DRJ22_04975 [Candidatus Woesearchaeota archaeon]